ncbi:MAG: hypothetical protein GXP45_04500 [bacterium]|nr:hypothetical protein [bacterium]
MYGTDTCPHCAAQKELFGVSFAKVDYINCQATPKVCSDANVNSVPTWEFSDGSRLQGTQELKTLGEKAGCKLPEQE